MQCIKYVGKVTSTLYSVPLHLLSYVYVVSHFLLYIVQYGVQCTVRCTVYSTVYSVQYCVHIFWRKYGKKWECLFVLLTQIIAYVSTKIER